MHTDSRTLQSETHLEADICIVGAGAAGITIAREFVNTRTRVILAESGGFDYDDSIQDLYDVEDVGTPNYPHMATRTSRVRYFGGTTNSWGGMARPLDPIDFRHRPWIEHSGWPIDRETLRPYYIRAQDVCSTGPDKFEDIGYWEDESGDRRRLPLSEDEIETKIYQYSASKRFGPEYRAELLEARNVTILTHANMVNIETDEAALHATSLRFKCLTGSEFDVRARFVVLACGAIENARILLSSRDVNPAGVGNDEDVVGRYFGEHPHMFAADVIPESTEHPAYLYGHFEKNGTVARALLHTNEAYQERNGLLNMAAALYPSRQTGFRALKDLVHGLMGRPMEYGLTNDLKWIAGDLGSIARSVLDSFSSSLEDKVVYDPPRFFSSRYPLRLYLKLEQQPNPSSRIILGRRQDALGGRIAEIDWKLTDLDRETVYHSGRMIMRALEESGFAVCKPYDWLSNGVAEWPDIEVWGHHIGTTRMGTNKATSVVDADCKVHDVDNLFVAGSSVFPTAGCVNPTFTIVALAVRIADELKVRLSEAS